MRYWDTSSIVPLIISEQRSAVCQRWATSDPQIVTWWQTVVECASALNRLGRDGALDQATLQRSLDYLNRTFRTFAEVLPSERVRTVALRLLRVHALRAADALQLAAAIVVSNEDRSMLEFVSFDVRLVQAAQREGFTCLTDA